MNQNIRITADYREKPSGIPDKLIQKDVEVSITSLPVGDYIINDQIIVERKSAEDFIQSIINNRLFDQCARLKRKAERSFLLIEGNPYKTNHDIDKQAIRGAILSIMVSWQIPIMFSKDTEDSAEILIMTGKQAIKENRLIPLINGYKPKKIKSHRLRFLQGLPSIGPKLANRLFDNFGNIESVIVAPVEELMGIDGIGKKGASRIKEFVTRN
ncbi:MAG: ERCC4 domain-containing protein [Bacteroidota bacterium]